MRIQIIKFHDETSARWMWEEHHIKPGAIREVRHIHYGKYKRNTIIKSYRILVMNYGNNNNRDKYTECSIYPDECIITLNKKSYEKLP